MPKKSRQDILPKRPLPHPSPLPALVFCLETRIAPIYLTFRLSDCWCRRCADAADFLTLLQHPLSVSYMISSKRLLFENIVMLGLFHFQSLSLSFRKYILKRWVLLHWLCSVTMIFHLSIIGTCYGATSVWYDKQITGWTNTPHHHQHNHLFSVVVVGHSI